MVGDKQRAQAAETIRAAVRQGGALVVAALALAAVAVILAGAALLAVARGH